MLHDLSKCSCWSSVLLGINRILTQRKSTEITVITKQRLLCFVITWNLQLGTTQCHSEILTFPWPICKLWKLIFLVSNFNFGFWKSTKMKRKKNDEYSINDHQTYIDVLLKCVLSYCTYIGVNNKIWSSFSAFHQIHRILISL